MKSQNPKQGLGSLTAFLFVKHLCALLHQGRGVAGVYTATQMFGAEERKGGKSCVTPFV